jgi:hypothetical protein
MNQIDLELNVNEYANVLSGFTDNITDLNVRSVPPVLHYLLVTTMPISSTDLVPLYRVSRTNGEVFIFNPSTTRVQVIAFFDVSYSFLNLRRCPRFSPSLCFRLI